MTVSILNGDCRDVLKTLDADSFDCVVTSPPYYGLRDYGCEGQIGLEPTLDAYVEQLCAVFDELWRVLKPTGTAWLNIGDSYAGSWGNQGRKEERGTQRPINGPMMTPVHDGRYPTSGTNTGSLDKHPGLKPKDLCGVPWRVAFALQARGWYLRSAVVWHKPNPMPESVRDRPTSAYEMVFLLTKAERYFYDADAIAEDATYANCGRDSVPQDMTKMSKSERVPRQTAFRAITQTRNARNVWTIAPKPFKGSHFATMPPDLAERCIKAGCPVGGRVLDPFGGAGTTALVAERLGRHATLIELNPAYRDMAKERIFDAFPVLPLVQTVAYEATK